LEEIDCQIKSVMKKERDFAPQNSFQATIGFWSETTVLLRRNDILKYRGYFTPNKEKSRSHRQSQCDSGMD